MILLTVGIFACAPAIIKYLELFIFKTGDVSTTFPEYVEYIITLALFIMILAIEIRWLEKAEIPAEELIPIKDQVK